jgi:hypothetical protein
VFAGDTPRIVSSSCTLATTAQTSTLTSARADTPDTKPPHQPPDVVAALHELPRDVGAEEAARPDHQLLRTRH